MWSYVLPATFTLVLWWFSTGAIIYLDGLPRRTFRWSLLGASVVMAAGFYGLWASAGIATPTGAYLAFASALAVWAWLEMSFYLGYVTGPRTQPCPEGCRGWAHFGHAIMASLWHELAILAAAGAAIWLTWGQANAIGLWTFVVLWWMHQSAKLNVFLGVRNLSEEFVPEHLTFLRSFLTRRQTMNPLFPVSVTVSTVICAYLVEAAIQPGASAFEVAGFAMLAALMALAILEHWVLMLPLPVNALWSWSLTSRGERQPFEVEIVAGFLGAGKTTFLRRMLADADPNVRTVALINDFGELGVDGSLLAGRGAQVVELPNGCICCSLRRDLAQQLRETIAKYRPRRVLIEPSGVADVAGLLRVLEDSGIKPLVRKLRLYTVIDAGAFLRDYAAMPEHFETQARLSPAFVVNKTDLASAGELELIRDTLHGLNPDALILPARHGRVDAGSLDQATVRLLGPERVGEADQAHAHTHGHGGKADSAPENGLGLRTWSARLSGECDPQSLRDVLDAVAHGAFGDVARVKGIVRSGAGWVHFDVAGGRSSVAAFAPRDDDEPRVVAIGREVDGARLQAAFEACRAPVVGTC